LSENENENENETESDNENGLRINDNLSIRNALQRELEAKKLSIKNLWSNINESGDDSNSSRCQSRNSDMDLVIQENLLERITPAMIDSNLVPTEDFTTTHSNTNIYSNSTMKVDRETSAALSIVREVDSSTSTPIISTGNNSNSNTKRVSKFKAE